MADLQITTDNLGRRVIEHNGATYFLTAGQDRRVIRETETTSTDRNGRLWRTPRRKAISGPLADRITATFEGTAS